MISKPGALSLLTTLACSFLPFTIEANPVRGHPSQAATCATANTTSGKIVGHASGQYPDVAEYLGIPFAQPPLGELRFKAPKAYVGHDTITANNQPLSCIQQPSSVNSSQPQNWQNIDITNGIFANHSSEDCLYLNVWTKPRSNRSGLKPVMIWLYGGGFHSGGISDVDEQGGVFAEENDVVFVSANYRLGIFGFSGAPGETQNVALLDQRLAVEWVRDNAKAFGGDPERITLFGHSAGGSSVDYYDYAWVDDPIIAASIPMSGGVDNFGRRFPNTTAAGWSETAKLVGCGNGNVTAAEEPQVISCMQSKSAADIFHASLNATKSVTKLLDAESQIYVGITGLFGPTIDNTTVFSNYTVRANEGKIIKKPTVIGENSNEGCFFAMKGQIPVSYEAEVTEAVFICPGAWSAIWRAQNSIPTWKYSWKGTYPNMYAPACPGTPWHGLEVYVLFNSTQTATLQPATADEVAAGRYLRHAWSEFARDPVNGLSSQLQWPTFNSNESNVINLAPHNTSGFDVGSAVATDAQCFTIYRGGAPDF